MKNIPLLLIINILYFCLIQNSISLTSDIFPIYKIIFSPNLNELDSNTYNFILNDIKGIGLIFDPNSTINLMPMHLMRHINKYYEHFEEVMVDFIPRDNGYSEIILNYYYGGAESLHLIMENSGISIPFAELFVFIYEENIHKFKFLTKENQENIIIGKDLIELMGVDLKDVNKFVINNEKYISKLEDEDKN